MRGSRSTLILGLGNELLCDEGLGVHVARALIARSHRLPASVAVVDAGTALLDVLAEVAAAERVILIDAVRAGGEPGTLYRGENLGDLLARQPARDAVSLHEFGVAETLQAARRAGLLPERVDLIGAEPGSMEPGLELSPAVEEAARRIVALLLDELGDQATVMAGSR